MKIIPEIPLVPHPITKEAKDALGYKWNDEVGFRHQLGGHPTEITVDQYPLCIECGNTMSFYAQIDSIGDNYDLADCMVIHQFVCFDCFTVKAQLNQI